MFEGRKVSGGFKVEVPEDFSQANGAEVLGMTVGFRDAVGAVHVTGVGSAVLEGEDVPGFVRGDAVRIHSRMGRLRSNRR